MWSIELARKTASDGPVIIAVNPASLIGSKMVNEAFGVKGKDLSVGADILCRLALDDEFSDKTGQYFDNDKGAFTSPHIDAMDEKKRKNILKIIDKALQERKA